MSDKAKEIDRHYDELIREIERQSVDDNEFLQTALAIGPDVVDDPEVKATIDRFGKYRMGVVHNQQCQKLLQDKYPEVAEMNMDEFTDWLKSWLTPVASDASRYCGMNGQCLTEFCDIDHG